MIPSNMWTLTLTFLFLGYKQSLSSPLSSDTTTLEVWALLCHHHYLPHFTAGGLKIQPTTFIYSKTRSLPIFTAIDGIAFALNHIGPTLFFPIKTHFLLICCREGATSQCRLHIFFFSFLSCLLLWFQPMGMPLFKPLLFTLLFTYIAGSSGSLWLMLMKTMFCFEKQCCCLCFSFSF